MKFTTSCLTFLFKLVVVVSYITGLHTVLDTLSFFIPNLELRGCEIVLQRKL